MMKYILLAIILTLGVLFEQSSLAFDLEAMSEVNTEFLQKEVEFEWKKNPFQKKPGFTKIESSEVKLKLDAVVQSEDGPMAMINGEYYSLGEYVSEKVIVEIGSNYVLLEGLEDSLVELTIPPVRVPASEISVIREKDE